MGADCSPLGCCAEAIIAAHLGRNRRVIAIGPMGAGKSTLLLAVARVLHAAGRRCEVLGADPGTPAFGPPGALSLAIPSAEGWQVEAFEPLCTLDAVRFRLPLLEAARRLADRPGRGTLLIDAPGVIRGPGAGELLSALVETLAADLILLLGANRVPESTRAALDLAGVELQIVEPDPGAHRPGPRARARSRTAAWDLWLADSSEQRLSLAGIPIIGTQPPVDQPADWVGRQLALMDAQRRWSIGEILSRTDSELEARIRPPMASPRAILIRDARRGAGGLLETPAPYLREPAGFLPPAAPATAVQADTGGPRAMARVGALDALLVNGIFGDPLLHVRIRHSGRSLLFDLGEGNRLSARLAHQVSDCFISHAHMDHLSGFIWLLRSRLGELPPCRLYGPPGIARHIHALIQGFLWDRIGDCGPAFEISELHPERIERFYTQAGHASLQARGSEPVRDGCLLVEDDFRVRAVTLDHKTPVLAFALEPDDETHVRKDRLRERGLVPGPWLGRLKSALRADAPETGIALPDNTIETAGELARALILTAPGKRLVYATDLADTPANRTRLIDLARNAHTLFLEATFAEADRAHAQANGHLTARACGEIAESAGVSRLIPLHLSRRYQRDPSDLLDELRAACPRVVLPRVG